jgi:hypothetical protein
VLLCQHGAVWVCAGGCVLLCQHGAVWVCAGGCVLLCQHAAVWVCAGGCVLVGVCCCANMVQCGCVCVVCVCVCGFVRLFTLFKSLQSQAACACVLVLVNAPRLLVSDSKLCGKGTSLLTCLGVGLRIADVSPRHARQQCKCQRGCFRGCQLGIPSSH